MNRTPGEIARTPRVSVAHEAMLVMSDGSEHAVTITDVSSGGFHLRSNETFPIGAHVFLRVPRYGDFPAQIRWALGGDAGGVFLEPVDLPTS
ncbi:MAG: PilZ domain-containing protein [Sphingomicrobium sp.]